MFIVGGAHIEQPLAPIAAMAGHDVTVVDPCRAFATGDRLPGLLVSAQRTELTMAQLNLDAQTAIAILRHDPKLGNLALVAAFATRAFYIGAPSTRMHAKRLARLTEAGLGDLLRRIRAPMRLDL